MQRSFISNLNRGITKRINKLFSNPYKKAGFNWWKVKQLKHMPGGKERQQPFLGKQIAFVDPAELLHGVKEIFIDELYRQSLSTSPYIIDCGANIGLSVIYMKRLAPGARIVAFEPDDKNFQLLEKNVSSFGLDKVILRKEAVWTDNCTLHFANAGSMSSHISESATAATTEVQAIRLKDLLTENIDFLKIDIEGAEYAVLNDCKDNLHWVNNLFIEYHGSFGQTRELTSILNWITERGFSFYIKEAAPVFHTPFHRDTREGFDYDVQLNIFCFRDGQKK